MAALEAVATPVRPSFFTRYAGRLMVLGVLAMVWIVAGVAYPLLLLRNQHALQAQFETVDPSASLANAKVPEYVSLSGRPPGGHYLSERTSGGRVDATFVPLVTEGGGAVHWIVRWSGAKQPRAGPTLARYGGDAPTLALREAFERMGVRVADDAVLADGIASQNGVAVDRAGDIRTDVIGIAAFVSAIVVVGAGMLWIINRLSRREK